MWAASSLGAVFVVGQRRQNGGGSILKLWLGGNALVVVALAVRPVWEHWRRWGPRIALRPGHHWWSTP